VSPEEVAPGATVDYTFSVPNEEAPASTIAVEVFFPPDAKFTTVTPTPKPGWTATPGATSVKWSGGSISGDKEEQFAVRLGPAPDAAPGGSFMFKVLQTYDDGTVVRWIDAPTPSGEPEHPAPVVRLSSVSPTSSSPASSSPSSTSAASDTTRAKAAKHDSGSNAVPALIAIALVVAGIGIGIAVVARRHRVDAG
jgi:uncharacterized protein YcnI